METTKIYTQTLNRLGFQVKYWQKAITVILLLLSFSTSYCQDLDKQKLNQFFEQLDTNNKAMGTVVISQNGNILYDNSIGYSYISDNGKKEISKNTRFRIGSITKIFTASVILQLVEEGQLKLIDKLDEFYPKIPNSSTITIQDLLSHKTGIQDVLKIKEFRMHRSKPITKKALLDIVMKGTSEFEPRSKFEYSNSNYILLAGIIEKVTDKSYEDVVNEQIIKKIGLENTYIGTTATDITKNESFSYRNLEKWEQVPETHISLLFGSGSIISTTYDLVKFIQALYDGKIVSTKSLSKMIDIKESYGLGIDTFEFAGKTFYGHTGGIDNYGSWLAYLPEEKLTIAYTSNGKVYPVSKIMDGIIDIYFKRPFIVPTFETVEVNPEILDQYVGVYSIPNAPMKFTVTRDGNTLILEMTGRPAVPLETINETKFGIESAGIIFEFDAEKGQMTQSRGGRQRTFTKEK